MLVFGPVPHGHEAAEGKLKLGTRLHERLLSERLDVDAWERVHATFFAALSLGTNEISCNSVTVSDMAQRIDWILDETVASLFPSDTRVTRQLCDEVRDADVAHGRPLHAVTWLEASRVLFTVALPILTESLARNTRGPSGSEISSALALAIQESVCRASRSYVETMVNRIGAMNRTHPSTVVYPHVDEDAQGSRMAVFRDDLIHSVSRVRAEHSGPIIDSVIGPLRRAAAEINDTCGIQ